MFRSDDRARVDAFAQGLGDCHRRLGVSVGDTVLPGVVYVALARGERVLAGLRLHPRGPGPLPVEQRLRLPSLSLRLDQVGPVAEVAALWSSPEVAGTGVGAAAVAAGVQAATELGWTTLVALGHQHNRFPPSVGFVADPTLGEFPFPDARYRSIVHWRFPAGPTTGVIAPSPPSWSWSRPASRAPPPSLSKTGAVRSPRSGWGWPKAATSTTAATCARRACSRAGPGRPTDPTSAPWRCTWVFAGHGSTVRSRSPRWWTTRTLRRCGSGPSTSRREGASGWPSASISPPTARGPGRRW